MACHSKGNMEQPWPSDRAGTRNNSNPGETHIWFETGLEFGERLTVDRPDSLATALLEF